MISFSKEESQNDADVYKGTDPEGHFLRRYPRLPGLRRCLSNLCRRCFLRHYAMTRATWMQRSRPGWHWVCLALNLTGRWREPTVSGEKCFIEVKKVFLRKGAGSCMSNLAL